MKENILCLIFFSILILGALFPTEIDAAKNVIVSNFHIRNNTWIAWDLSSDICYKQTLYVAPTTVKILELSWDLEYYFANNFPNQGKPVGKNPRREEVLPLQNKNLTGPGGPCVVGIALIVLEKLQPVPTLQFTVGNPVLPITQDLLYFDFGLWTNLNNLEIAPRSSTFQIIFDETFPILEQGDRLMFHVEHTCSFYFGPIGAGLFSALVEPYIIW
jgi:hypothetical protein